MPPPTPALLYGIPNCDSVKKARTWFAQQGLACEFHDFKKHGVPPQQLAHWLQVCDWQTLLNRKGSTWRQLDAATQAQVCDSASAQALMLTHPSSIKRPVIEWPSGAISVGFNPEGWPL